MLVIRRATPADFDAVGRVIESSYETHDPSRSLPGRHPSEPGGAPFSWWGDAALSWWVASVGEHVAGFALWRHEQRNAHLHSLFVAADHQRHGVGAALTRFHFAQAARENAGLSSLTLHVHSEATWARAFYARCGYVERDPRSVAVTEDSGLGDWIRTYARFGWPEDGKLLLVRAPAPEDRNGPRESVTLDNGARRWTDINPAIPEADEAAARTAARMLAELSYGHVNATNAETFGEYVVRWVADREGRIVSDREPTPADLIVPSRLGRNRNANHMLRRFHQDLGRLGMRVRRQHDSRRTFISLAREGKATDFLKWATTDPGARSQTSTPRPTGPRSASKRSASASTSSPRPPGRSRGRGHKRRRGRGCHHLSLLAGDPSWDPLF